MHVRWTHSFLPSSFFLLLPPPFNLHLIIMYFASIALTLVLSLSGVVYGAPMPRDTNPPQVCTGTNGSGTCTNLNFAPTDSNGNPKDSSPSCTNVSNAKSLVMDVSDDCETFPFSDCVFINPANPDDIGVVNEVFSDEPEAGDLSSIPQIASISCSRIDGLVNGLFPQ
ncbi:hypothetical protein B0H17DRAFT_636725 [Mycena rosella]|uniref:Uncharacterized protein n=1 Tax=Mycena rosella TaxID=1033263 RepID=A0AAD7GHL0_MYCRO|nr:hypothetical protein B0H17DRAFT_636725 [Mycena rosella]